MNQEAIIEYLRRSYFAVDGLWFMIAEDDLSFDEALRMDKKVWEILPKIQARKAKELLNLEGKGLQDFFQAIKLKFNAEQYIYKTPVLETNHIQIIVDGCPWYNILKKAKREHLEPKIADHICLPEFQVWLREFGENLEVSFQPRCNVGKSFCVFDFHSR